MEKLTGKCLEAFLIFLVQHFRKYRPDYAKFSDEVIIAKFQRRHIIDQAGILALFLDYEEGQDNAEEIGTRHMISDIEEFNKEFNSINS
jgi:hypothetical protein